MRLDQAWSTVGVRRGEEEGRVLRILRVTASAKPLRPVAALGRKIRRHAHCMSTHVTAHGTGACEPSRSAHMGGREYVCERYRLHDGTAGAQTNGGQGMAGHGGQGDESRRGAAAGQRPASRGRRPAQPALRVGAMGLLGISGPDGERLIRLRCTVLCGNA